jgi:hypothetical protein
MVSLRGPAILFDLDPVSAFTADPDPAIHFEVSGSGIFIQSDLGILTAPGLAELYSYADPASQNYADLCGMRIQVSILLLQIHTQKWWRGEKIVGREQPCLNNFLFISILTDRSWLLGYFKF